MVSKQPYLSPIIGLRYRSNEQRRLLVLSVLADVFEMAEVCTKRHHGRGIPRFSVVSRHFVSSYEIVWSRSTHPGITLTKWHLIVAIWPRWPSESVLLPRANPKLMRNRYLRSDRRDIAAVNARSPVANLASRFHQDSCADGSRAGGVGVRNSLRHYRQVTKKRVLKMGLIELMAAYPGTSGKGLINAWIRLGAQSWPRSADLRLGDLAFMAGSARLKWQP